MPNQPFQGTVQIEGTEGTIAQIPTIVLDGDRAAITVGAGSANVQGGRPSPGIQGKLVVLNNKGQQVLFASDALGGTIQLYGPDEAPGIYLGAGAAIIGANRAAIQLDGKNGDLVLRSNKNLGGVFYDSIVLRGSTCELQMGGSQPGVIVLSSGPFQGEVNPGPTIRVDGGTATLSLGGSGKAGTIVLRDGHSKESIQIDGGSGNIQLFSGDIRLSNADCAEDFEIIDPEHAEPGTVMVISDPGALRRSERPYDRRVAGVISGAKDLKPGIVLRRSAATRTRHPVALVGRVYCRVDADHGAIAVGDLLTTSPTPGHAMRAGDPLRSPGAVLGKALDPLADGRGLIRVLVALQ
jgi:hypothetical protein